MPVRTAHADWAGSLQHGAGRVSLASSEAGSFDVSFPRGTADVAGGVTSPEELLAAAHSACYAMQLSSLVAAAGGSSKALEVTADVRTDADTAGDFRITSITLRVRGRVEGLDIAAFAAATQQAKATCPVSRALAGVEISLDATLES